MTKRKHIIQGLVEVSGGYYDVEFGPMEAVAREDGLPIPTPKPLVHVKLRMTVA